MTEPIPRGKDGKPLKLVRGNRPSILSEPTGQASLARIAPEMPDHLDDVEAAEWRRVIPVVQKARKLHEASHSVAVSHCEAWSMYRELREAWRAGKASSREVKDARQEYRASARMMLITPADDATLIEAIEHNITGIDPFETTFDPFGGAAS